MNLFSSWNLIKHLKGKNNNDLSRPTKDQSSKLEFLINIKIFILYMLITASFTGILKEII